MQDEKITLELSYADVYTMLIFMQARFDKYNCVSAREHMLEKLLELKPSFADDKVLMRPLSLR